MIAVVNYGVGNLFSLCSSLRAVGADVTVTGDPDVIRAAERIVLPGVGAFEDAARKLSASGLEAPVREAAEEGKPLLGICLGMQLLFERSLEYGEHKGLGLIPGTVAPLAGRIPDTLKIPHMGWNALRLHGNAPIFKYIRDGEYVYFVHSYAAVGCGEYVIADTEYGEYLTAAVRRGSVYGCQFHPEKSGAAGLSILKAFTEL
ncbi:MAG: imidazole glycerol phosphate synthase subunit HisH [Clostridia bacterium]|nr:imidazole glycerol phosphate synthase subunit HisH [Clostridia bacterium]